MSNPPPDRALYAGIPNALKAFAETYEHISRRSGRTTALIANLRDGDYVVTTSRPHALHIERMARETEVKITVLISSPKRGLGEVAERLRARQPGSRVLFEHDWITAYWMGVIETGSADFWAMQDYFNPQSQESYDDARNHFHGKGHRIL